MSACIPTGVLQYMYIVHVYTRRAFNAVRVHVYIYLAVYFMIEIIPVSEFQYGILHKSRRVLGEDTSFALQNTQT